MARQARQRSSTGIYHIMLRGIDKRDIFLDNQDRRKFIESLFKAREAGGFKIYGYCLMDNHVHMLLQEDEVIGTSMKRITVRYVWWHNDKYERTGHLFQNRFSSEPVETDNYFLTVLRYIHQNPLKARLVNRLEDYEWSSYNQYLLAYQGFSSPIDFHIIKNYFTTLDDFCQYMNASNDDECLEYKPINKTSDSALRNRINEIYNIDDLSTLTKKDRNEIIRKIYHESNTSIRQLSRVLGISKAIIERVVKQDR